MTEDSVAAPHPSNDIVPAVPPAPVAPAPPAPMLESEARTYAMLINIIAVAGAVLSAGTLSLVAVLVMWLINRQRSALVDFHGKQQLNLALTLVTAGVVTLVGTIVTFGFGALVLLPLMIAYGIWALIGSIIAAVRASSGDYYRIALVIPFIR